MKCPKCGSASSNERTCDFCGALIDRILAREKDFGQSGELFDSGFIASEPAQVRTGPSLQKIVIGTALLAGVVAVWFFIDSRSRVHLDQVLANAKLPPEPEKVHYSPIQGRYVTNSSIPPDPECTIVEYWAEWCGPCRMYTPTLEGVAKRYGDKLRLVRLNVDENPQSASTAGVRAIPATLVFDKAGKLRARHVGAIPESMLCESIDDASKI